MNTANFKYNWPLILAYHSISLHRTDALAVNISDFEMQMSWLNRRGYRSITLADFVLKKYHEGERIAIITFDDGYEDNYSQAFPILKKYKFVATIFLVSEYVNTDHIFYWDKSKISNQFPNELFRIMSWNQVHEMAEFGIEFGSHSCTHPELAKISSDQCWKEINQSRIDLKNKLQREIFSFSYPRGNLNNDTMTMVEKAGYSCAVVTPTRWGIPLNAYTLRRVGIYYENSFNTFRLKIHPLVGRNKERLLWFKTIKQTIK